MILVASRQKRKRAATISVGNNIHFSNPSSQTGEEINGLIQLLTNDNQKLANEVTGLKFENIVLQEKYDLLAFKRFARSSEQENSDSARQSLFDEEAGKAETEAEKPEIVPMRIFVKRTEADRKDTQKSYMWLARGGPPDKPVIICKYHPSRASEHTSEFVDGFTGFPRTDGYAGYDCARLPHESPLSYSRQG
jgi:hypothetical protein